ncbi:MAG: nucleotidyltransferase domain-containing protein [Nitrospirota bacterium]
MDRDEIMSLLKTYFQSNAEKYNIDMAFLYGSWASGHPKKESDVDIAVVFTEEMKDDKVFEIITSISLELTDILKKEVNTLFIDNDLSRPMIYYNAIVHGIPVYFRDFTRYSDIRMLAIHRMEDFSIFGLKWQEDIVRRRMEALNRG